MLRVALRRAAAEAAFLSSPRGPLSRTISISLATTRPLRFYGTNGPDHALPQQLQQQQQQVALQMIQYALGHARSQKSGESYAQAMLVLEQGLSNLRGGGGDVTANDDAMGMLLLSMSTLLHERGELNDAIEKLRMVHQMGQSSLGMRVAAWEGLIGLNLEAGQDAASSVAADECLQLLKSRPEDSTPAFNILNLRGKAIKGLVDLVFGNLKSAELNFAGCEGCDLKEGNVALSCGEFLHATGNFSSAKDFYERAVRISEAKDISEISSLAAANMVPDEVLLGATCALGQVLMHSGKFQDAEDSLTKALNKAEEHFGSNHPKVGVVLTCIAMMFGHKAKLERSSSLLIQEGLYRRAIDLLKSPPLDGEGADMPVDRRDVVALARGGYAEILCVQQNRKGEGERLRKWAETAWRNRRLSLAQALEISEPSKAAIIDTRISRVL